MGKITQQKNLALLEREIEEEQAALSRQAALVAWLAAAGQSTLTAEALLGSIEVTLASLLTQRELLLLEHDGDQE